MCIVKMVNDPYLNYECIFNLTRYALVGKPDKRIRYYGGYNVVSSRADEQIIFVKQYFQKEDKRLMRHFTVSFVDGLKYSGGCSDLCKSTDFKLTSYI